LKIGAIGGGVGAELVVRTAIDEYFPHGVVIHNVEIVVETGIAASCKSPERRVSFA